MNTLIQNQHSQNVEYQSEWTLPKATSRLQGRHVSRCGQIQKYCPNIQQLILLFFSFSRGVFHSALCAEGYSLRWTEGIETVYPEASGLVSGQQFMNHRSKERWCVDECGFIWTGSSLRQVLLLALSVPEEHMSVKETVHPKMKIQSSVTECC